MANLKNFAVGIILTPPTGTSGTSMVLQSGHGARMPTTFPYYLPCYPTGVLPTYANTEVVMVTARSTDTLTIVRGQRGSTAQTMAAGWIADNAIMTEDLFTSSRNAPEVLTGTPNGVLTTFTTSQPYTSVDLYKNGVYMQPGSGNDYTYSGSTVTFTTAPATGAKLVAVGIVGSQLMISGSDSVFAGVTAVGTPNGALTTFTVPSGSYIGGTLEVFKNGISEQRGTHFIETSPTAGTFTFTTAPIANSVITVSGQIASSVAGNADTTDNFHAAATPTANTLVPLNSSSKFPISVLPSGTKVRLSIGKLSTSGTVVASSYVTYISVTTTSFGGEVEADFRAFLANGNSGADRNTLAKVQVDGVDITPVDLNTGQRSGNSLASENTFSFMVSSTPAAGSHTWTFQLKASTGSAVILDWAVLEITEIVA